MALLQVNVLWETVWVFYGILGYIDSIFSVGVAPPPASSRGCPTSGVMYDIMVASLRWVRDESHPFVGYV